MLFTARDHSGVLCIGLAHSKGGAAGPYQDAIGGPLMKNSTGMNYDPLVDKLGK